MDKEIPSRQSQRFSISFVAIAFTIQQVLTLSGDLMRKCLPFSEISSHIVSILVSTAPGARIKFTHSAMVTFVIVSSIPLVE